MDENEVWWRGFTATKLQYKHNDCSWKFAYADHILHWKRFPTNGQSKYKSFGYARSIGLYSFVSGNPPKEVKHLAKKLGLTAKLTTSKFNQWQLQEDFDVEKTIFKIISIDATSDGFFNAHYFCTPLKGVIEMNHQSAEEIIEFVTKNRNLFPQLDNNTLKRASIFSYLEYIRINHPSEYLNSISQLDAHDIEYLKTYQPDEYALLTISDST